MLGESDELDLTDPLRDVDGETGDWIDLTPVVVGLPRFVEYPKGDFTLGGPDPTEPVDLRDDGGPWEIAGWWAERAIFAAGVLSAVAVLLWMWCVA